MPFEGININKYLPNADLGRFIARTQMVGDASPEARRGGLAELTMIEDREERERKRKFEEEQKREEFQQKFRQDRFAETIKQYKESSSPDERRKLRAGMVMQLVNLGIRDPDEMDLVLNEVAATPLQETEEQKADLKNLSAQEMEIFNSSTPESQKMYVQARNANIPKEKAMLLFEPERKIDLKAYNPEHDIYKVDEQGNRTLVSKGTPKAPKKTSAQLIREENQKEVLGRLSTAREKYNKEPTFDNKLEFVKRAIFASDLYGDDAVIKRRKLDDLEVPEVALRRFDKAGKGVIALLDKDSAAGTVGAGTAKAIRSITETLKSFEALIPDWEGGFKPSRGKYQKQLNRLAGANDELQSRYYGIAYLNIIANGLSNQRVTNKMFEDALNDAKGTAGSPEAIKNKMNQIRQRLVDRLDAEMDTILGDTEPLTREFQLEDEQAAETSSRDRYLQRLREAAAKAKGAGQ